MTVTVTKKMTLKQAKNEEQNEKDLFWLCSLRQLIPPIGNVQKWKAMSPAACKLYLLLWALYSARFDPCNEDDGGNLSEFLGVNFHYLLQYSELKKPSLKKALLELLELQLIRADFTSGEFGQANYWYSIVIDPSIDVLENGV